MSESPDHNAADRERLRLLSELDDEALTADLEEGWTVGAALAHIAFWDRFVAERWRVTIERDSHTLIPREALVEMVHAANAAGLSQWRSMPPGAAARDAHSAAVELDAMIASLPPHLRSGVNERGLMLDRSPHRSPHLDAIFTALHRA